MQNERGRYFSEGEYEILGYPQTDGYDALTWIAAQPWSNGKVGTRNYIAVISSVNCSAAVSRYVADHFRTEEFRREFPNIDGIVPLTHGGGCGMAASGLEMDVLRRTLAGYTRHPNMAAVVVLGLGCETNQISGLMNAEGLKEGPKLIPMAIQDEGGLPGEGFEQLTPGTMSPQEYDSAIADLVAYMQWMGEPAQQQRTRIGVGVLIFLAIFFVIAWRLHAAFWKDVK